MPTSSLDNRMNIRTIVWPIFIEHLLRMSMMTIDVVMLARFSEEAVAAVGLTGHFVFFMVIAYMIISSGCAILIGQNLGAKNRSEALAFSHVGFLLALIMAAIIGLGFYLGAEPLLLLYRLEPQVHIFALQYLTITGGLSVGLSLSIYFSTVLRAHGFSKSPMAIQLISGALNVIGNYIALFGFMGLPVFGVVGVAISTVFSQLVGALLCWWIVRHHNIGFSIRSSFKLDFVRFKEILRLGLPNAGEGLSYNLAQLAIMFMVAGFGTAALAAVAIAQNLSRFVFVFAMSLGNGAQIMASYFVGQSRFDELKANVHRYWQVGITVSTLLVVMFIAAREPIAGYFTEDPETVKLIGVLLIAALALEPARALNLIVISALKGTGDVMFPVKMGILSMWGVGVLFSYLFGIHWGLGVLGVWLGVAMDEWARGIIMIIRWQSEKWRAFVRLSVAPLTE
ncbi:MATE family efflux transporter [Reinekea marina]|uniref:MATE family efflux transporter n=1 Tax=Reinekea marina TaxID=1310421 RepID=A0ABV7WTS6_9GAMM|nr:MATE family efflux transporter [Reinekea marina]MDN3650453.1 MATE family efflux transporter [Reinekea marina]